MTARGVAVVIAAAAGLALSACSPGADYQSIFPAVHDMPPPRPDTTLDPAQVQQATEDLITQRDHLSAEAQSGQSKNTQAKGTVALNPSASAAKPPARKRPIAQPQPAVTGSAGGVTQGDASADSQTAGTVTRQ